MKRKIWKTKNKNFSIYRFLSYEDEIGTVVCENHFPENYAEINVNFSKHSLDAKLQSLTCGY